MGCRMKYNADIIIGIDPDINKNGIAVLDVEKRRLEVSSLDIVDTVAFIKAMQEVCNEDGKDMVAVVEAGWLNGTHNWHGNYRDSKAVYGKKCYSVGENHRTGKAICQFVRAMGVPCIEQTPLRKMWRGKDKKITHEELVRVTGLEEKRTNQEERDAALLAWSFANLPIRL